MTISAAEIDLARAVPIESEIARRGGLGLKRRGKELIGACPKCGGDDRFAVNTAKNLFNCRGCGAAGDVIDLNVFLDGCDFAHAVTSLTGERPQTKANGKHGNGKNGQAAEPTMVDAGEWSYEDEAGNLLFETRRFEYRNANGGFVLKDGKRKKTFRQRRPDPEWGDWIWNLDGVRIVPYRLPELIEAIGNGHPIAVVEGEAKVDLLRSWGIPATCCAGGAGKWKPEHSAFLRGAEVIIVPDNDDAGRKHADIVGSSLQGTAASIRVLELPGLPAKGDVLDWAKAGGTVEQLHDLIERQAKPWAPRSQQDDGKDAGDFASKLLDSAAKQQPNVFNAKGLNQMTFDPIKFVVPGYIVEGLTLFAGKPKLGKSWLLLDFSNAVAEGGYTFFGNVKCEEGDVLYAALEDNQRRLQSRMTKLFGTKDWPARLHFTCEMPRLTEGGLDFLKNWIKSAKRPRLIVIDTLAVVRPLNRKEQGSYDADYAAVKELRDLALTYGIAIVLVHHLRKADADDPFDTVSGTLGLTGAPDTIMILSRNQSRGTILHAKGRDITGIEKAVRFDAGTCTWVVLGDAEAIQKSAERVAIVAVLEEAGAEALTPNQVAAACGRKPESVRKMMTRLFKDGVVKKTSYGKYILAAAATATQAAE
jgi:AAA domain/CHC2 zinc finger